MSSTVNYNASKTLLSRNANVTNGGRYWRWSLLGYTLLSRGLQSTLTTGITAKWSFGCNVIYSWWHCLLLTCSDTKRNQHLHYRLRKKVRWNFCGSQTLTKYYLNVVYSCRRILLDTGDGEQPEYFLNLKKSLNFDKISIKDIILSHWHPDHVGGTKEVLKSAEV